MYETVSNWTERLTDFCKNYDAKDIFNMDETGVFYRALPDRTLTMQAQACHGQRTTPPRNPIESI